MSTMTLGNSILSSCSFALIVLRTQKGATYYGEKPSECSFVNMLLCDYVCLTKLLAFF